MLAPLVRSFFLMASLASVGCAWTPGTGRPLGPLRYRTQHPLTMTFLDFESRSANTVGAGRVEVDSQLSYTSMFQTNVAPGASANFDGEWAEFSVHLRVGLTDRIELFATVPVRYTSSGFLDDFVEGYHDTFGLLQDGRDRFPSDQYAAQYDYDGRTIYRLREDTLGLGDVPIGIACRLVDEGDVVPAILGRVAIELPTGNEDDGFGNGQIDAGAGVVLEKSIGRFTIAAGADYTIIREASRMRGSGVDLDPLLGAFLSTELRLTTGFSAIVGLDYLSQPLSGFGRIKEARRDQLSLLIGGAFDLGGGAALGIDFVEDIVGDVGPDFTARVGLRFSF